MRLSSASVGCVFVLTAGGAAPPPTAPADGPASRPATAPASRPAGPRPYQPGVWIDWHQLQVELEATVILRQGLIELLACAPQLREHESILRVEARPLHVYQALGLIGLTPGHPMYYDPDTDRAYPAEGEPIEIDIRYPADGSPRTVPAESWLRAAGGGTPIGRLPWVFAGSIPVEGEAIAADFEGTVVATVDFATSVVALSRLHSSDNDQLWVQPRTRAIPPVGTRCRLLLRRGPLRIELDRAGRVHLCGARVRLSTLIDVARQIGQRDNRIRWMVVYDPASPKREQQRLRQLLERAGIRASAMDTQYAVVAPAGAHNEGRLPAWLRMILEQTP